jgi:hypothetical protein
MTDQQFKRIDERLNQIAQLLELLIAGNELLNRPQHARETLSALDEIQSIVRPMQRATQRRLDPDEIALRYHREHGIDDIG